MRRREAIKGVALVLIFAGMFMAAFAWAIPAVSWLYKLGGPVLLLSGFATFLVVHFKRDQAPDFLREQFGSYFDRDGFCFVISAGTHAGIGVLRLHFQSRYERPSVARVAARPKQQLFGLFNEKTIQAVTFLVDCPPAGYGVVTLPVPFAPKVHGKTIEVQVGASVKYPGGRGRTLRYADAESLSTDAEFDDMLGAVSAATAVLTGSIAWYSPASTRIAVPDSPAMPHTDDESTTEIRWKLGDAGFGGGRQP